MKSNNLSPIKFLEDVRTGAEKLSAPQRLYLERWIDKISDSPTYFEIFLKDVQSPRETGINRNLNNYYGKTIDSRVIMMLLTVHTDTWTWITSNIPLHEKVELSPKLRYYLFKEKATKLDQIITGTEIVIQNECNVKAVPRGKSIPVWDIYMNDKVYLTELDQVLIRKCILDLNVIFNIKHSRNNKSKSRN